METFSAAEDYSDVFTVPNYRFYDEKIHENLHL